MTLQKASDGKTWLALVFPWLHLCYSMLNATMHHEERMKGSRADLFILELPGRTHLCFEGGLSLIFLLSLSFKAKISSA